MAAYSASVVILVKMPTELPGMRLPALPETTSRFWLLVWAATDAASATSAAAKRARRDVICGRGGGAGAGDRAGEGLCPVAAVPTPAACLS